LYVYLTEVDLSIDNGPGINEREFVSALLRKYGDEVCCIVPRPAFPERYYNSEIEYVFSHNQKPVKYLVFLLSLFLKLYKLNRRTNIKILIVRLGEVPLVPLIFGKIAGIPIYLKTLAGYYLFEKKNRTITQKFRAALTLPLYRKVIQQSDLADTVSYSYIDWLHSKFKITKKRIVFIPNGVNIHFFSPQDKATSKAKTGLDHFDKLIGYVGAFDSLRHVEDLIRSMHVFQKVGRIGLILVGDGPEKNKLKQRVKSLGLEKLVIFKGFVDYKDVPAYINSFDVAVDFSLIPMEVNGRRRYASYSQKIPQYLSCGVPVIAWETEDTQFLRTEKIGEIIPVGEGGKISQAIKKFIVESNVDGYLLSKQCREFAEKKLAIEVLVAHRMKLWQQINYHEKS